MPATYDPAFALWLTQHGSARAAQVNVLQFVHPAFPGDIWVSDYGEEFAAVTEGGANFTALPLGFVIDTTTDNTTTEQRLMLRLDNANGLVAQELRKLTDEQLLTPVAVTHRVYLDSDRTGPVNDPITLYVTNANMNRLAVELEVTADYLPNVAAGTRTTIERFPSLAFL